MSDKSIIYRLLLLVAFLRDQDKNHSKRLQAYLLEHRPSMTMNDPRRVFCHFANNGNDAEHSCPVLRWMIAIKRTVVFLVVAVIDLAIWFIAILDNNSAFTWGDALCCTLLLAILVAIWRLSKDLKRALASEFARPTHHETCQKRNQRANETREIADDSEHDKLSRTDLQAVSVVMRKQLPRQPRDGRIEAADEAANHYLSHFDDTTQGDSNE